MSSMTAARFLTYEEELVLSDSLVARRQQVRALQEQGVEGPQTPEQMEIEQAGRDAATKLVGAYLPFIRSLAYGVKLHQPKRGNQVDVNDLLNTGVVAALKNAEAFDARGEGRHTPGGRAGVRFSTYCKLHVLREMNRLVTRMSTPVYANVDVIAATWTYLAARAELQDHKGSLPTPEEVEEMTGISSEYIIHNLPSRVGMLDVADDSVANASVIETETQMLMDTEMYNGILEHALREVLDTTVVDVLLSLLGVDLGVPRSVSETARHLGMRRGEVAEYEPFCYDALRHPQNRTLITRALRRLLADTE